MEQAPKSPEQNPAEKLSLADQFRVLLNMFGTDKAREAFLENCKAYLNARNLHVATMATDSENYFASKKINYSNTGRANLHNDIMVTIGKIATETKNITPEQQAVLRDFYDREIVAEAIKAYVFSEQDREYYEEEVEEKNAKDKEKMPEATYYHNLGKGQ